MRLGADFTGVAVPARRVVVLRDQHLDCDPQVAFAQRFGSLTLGHGARGGV